MKNWNWTAIITYLTIFTILAFELIFLYELIN